MAGDEILTPRDVAEHLKLTERTLRLTQEGRLPGFKAGNSWRFRLQHVEVWIEAQRAAVRRDGGRR